MGRNEILKLRITGPESTGKSSLAKQLSTYFNEPWVPEVARSYLANLGRPYNQQDLDVMLQQQMEQEALAALRAKQFIICDTGPEVFWIWSKYKFGSVSSFISETFNGVSYHQTLLLNIDLPWESDPLRENPNYEERKAIFELYNSLLSKNNVDYEVVSGIGENRFRNALTSLTINS